MGGAGAPWRDLSKRYGPWSSVYSRFRRWKEAGLWDRVLPELQAQGDLHGKVNWEIHFVDGIIARPHQHATGAKRFPTAEALGHSPDGLSTKIHVLSDEQGKPITFILTPGQQHEITMAERLLEQGAIRRGRTAAIVCDPSAYRATRDIVPGNIVSTCAGEAYR